jgi:flagellar hook-associated protein 2
MAIQMSGLASGMDTESMVAELMNAQRMKSTKIENKITKLEWKQDVWKSLNTKIYSFYTNQLSKLKMQGSYLTKKVSSTNEDKVTVAANGSAPSGSHSIQVKKLASAQFITGSEIELDKNGKAVTGSTKLTDLGFSTAEGTVITVKAGDKDALTLNVNADVTINDFVSTCTKAGLNCQYDTQQDRFFISSKESGYQNAFSITSSPNTTNKLSMLGLSEITTTTTNGVATTVVDSNVKLVNSSDASIIYNGAELSSPSNTINANGLTFTVKAVTAGANTVDASDDEIINLSVTNDTQAVYDMVKSFVKTYNELLDEMNKYYYADNAKGYDPLTDDQKESMTDDQITKWEDKIKASILRRDSSVSTILSSMRSAFSTNVKVDDKAYNLASFGIVTTDYTEKGKLHIYGDSEDSTTASKTDKLMATLNSNPEAVMEVLTKMTGNLYNTLTDKMASTSLNSALTLYNDKEMKSTLKRYNEDLDNLEDKLSAMESRYNKQFTAMEKALSSLNSQSSSLAAMLGTPS